MRYAAARIEYVTGYNRKTVTSAAMASRFLIHRISMTRQRYVAAKTGVRSSTVPRRKRNCLSWLSRLSSLTCLTCPCGRCRATPLVCVQFILEKSAGFPRAVTTQTARYHILHMTTQTARTLTKRFLRRPGRQLQRHQLRTPLSFHRHRPGPQRPASRSSGRERRVWK